MWSRFFEIVYDVRKESFHFGYSADGYTYSAFGETFEPGFGYWKGARLSLYCYNTSDTGGQAVFDDFIVDFEMDIPFLRPGGE